MTEPEQPATIPVDLRADGVLWMINKSVFHPRGFALAIEVESGNLTLMGDGRQPWTYDHDIEPELFIAFNELLERQAALMRDVWIRGYCTCINPEFPKPDCGVHMAQRGASSPAWDTTEAGGDAAPTD